MAESILAPVFVGAAGTAGAAPAGSIVMRAMDTVRSVLLGGGMAMAPSETRLEVPAVNTSMGAAPRPAARWLEEQRNLISDMEWIEPLQNVGAWDEDVFEWWCGARKVTVYLENGAAEFIKVWGADPDTEMESGTVEDFRGLWQWLTTTH